MRDFVAGFHLRQKSFALVFGFGFGRDIKFTPTRLLDDLASRRKIFALVFDGNDGLVEDVQRIKLHGVIFRNEIVNIELNGRQRHVQNFLRRDNRVVRRNFFVVPSTAFNRGVRMSRQFFQRVVD